VPRRLAVFLLIAATAIATAGVASAAAPPRNDTAAHATKVNKLPFTDTVDTTRATIDQDDRNAAGECGASDFPLAASVWYSYTSPINQTVTVDGSGYFAGIAVLQGSPSSLGGIACGTGEVQFNAVAGQTYYFDFVAIGQSGGTLHVSVTGSPGPAPAQCKKGGWQTFGSKNQGSCVSSSSR
jgi:hypothetical protein